MSRSRRTIAALAATTLAVSLAGCSSAHGARVATTAPTASKAPAVTSPAPVAPASSVAASLPEITAYRGGGPGGVAALATYEAWTGTHSTRGLDFLPDDSWTNLEGPAWLLNAWRSTGRQLTLSVAMFPKPTGAADDGSLAACANGDYDRHWTLLGRNLVSSALEDTVVRPGWEFNGNWFSWKASVSPANYASCFRHIVTAMRGVGGQRFSFDWNPNIGPGAFAAELAWPGDGYVNTVGVDAYDMSWAGGTFPIPDTATAAQRTAAQAKAFDAALNGNHGLAFWSKFAAAHNVAMSLPEWGLAVRKDGHGGNDDPYYITHMFDFIKDPANHVSYASYFDYNSGDGLHQISPTTGATPFPTAQAVYLAIVKNWVPVVVPTPSAAPTTAAPTTAPPVAPPVVVPPGTTAPAVPTPAATAPTPSAVPSASPSASAPSPTPSPVAPIPVIIVPSPTPSAPAGTVPSGAPGKATCP